MASERLDESDEPTPWPPGMSWAECLEAYGTVQAVDAETYEEVRRAFNDVEFGAGWMQLAGQHDLSLATIDAILDGRVPVSP